jgi:glutathione peroxidase
MKSMIVLVAMMASAASWASCPEYLDTTMRKLHSSEELNFCESFADRPMLIVNTASHCGFTPQFNGLEALHKKYGDKGLVVVGFASNDFRQEAKDEAEAAHVCYKNYGVSFTMMAPSHVKGEQANAVFKALAEQSKAPGWNFNKYLVDSEGRVVQHYGSGTTPESKELQAAIEQLL